MRHFVDCRSTGRGRGVDRRSPRRRCGVILDAEAEASNAPLAAVGPDRGLVSMNRIR